MIVSTNGNCKLKGFNKLQSLEDHWSGTSKRQDLTFTEQERLRNRFALGSRFQPSCAHVGMAKIAPQCSGQNENPRTGSGKVFMFWTEQLNKLDELHISVYGPHSTPKGRIMNLVCKGPQCPQCLSSERPVIQCGFFWIFCASHGKHNVIIGKNSVGALNKKWHFLEQGNTRSFIQLNMSNHDQFLWTRSLLKLSWT